MARVRLYVLIYVLALALVGYGFVDAVPREECKTAGCVKTVSNFMDTFEWGSNACNDFSNFACGAYRDTSIRPSNYDPDEISYAQLNNTKFGSAVSCPWPKCATRIEDIIAASYESSCSNRESSNTDLKNIVGLLKEANKIEKWTDLENWSVRRGLRSSFFKTYAAGDKGGRYHELVESSVDSRAPMPTTRLDEEAIVDPNTVILDLRPDAIDISASDNLRVERFLSALDASYLSRELRGNLQDGLHIALQLDQILTEKHKITSPEDHVLTFYQETYTERSDDGDEGVYWDELWSCGLGHYQHLIRKIGDIIVNITDYDSLICELRENTQDFNWTNHLQDHYWGSVAVSNDFVPLLHGSPDHWVVSPYLIPVISKFFVDYSNQRMKNFILWRMAWQLTRHIHDKATSDLQLGDWHHDCESTFSNTIKQLRSRYDWYDRFPEHTRKQFYTMWTDVNFQLKYLLFKRFPYAQILYILEYYPKFPFASTMMEPLIAVKVETPDTLTTLDIALNLQKVERALLLRMRRSDSNYNDIYYFIETLGIGVHERFLEDRPASLNFGALGSAIGYNILKLIFLYWSDDLAWLNNYKVCVEKNFPGFISNNDTKLYELASITFGLEAAWNAYEQHIALYGEKNLKMPPGRVGEDKSDITEYDNKRLFFASFGNSVCGRHSKELINVAVQMLPQFREAFGCEKNIAGAKWVDCQLD